MVLLQEINKEAWDVRQRLKVSAILVETDGQVRWKQEDHQRGTESLKGDVTRAL